MCSALLKYTGGQQRHGSLPPCHLFRKGKTLHHNHHPHHFFQHPHNHHYRHLQPCFVIISIVSSSYQSSLLSPSSSALSYSKFTITIIIIIIIIILPFVIVYITILLTIIMPILSPLPQPWSSLTNSLAAALNSPILVLDSLPRYWPGLLHLHYTDPRSTELHTTNPKSCTHYKMVSVQRVNKHFRFKKSVFGAKLVTSG